VNLLRRLRWTAQKSSTSLLNSNIIFSKTGRSVVPKLSIVTFLQRKHLRSAPKRVSGQEEEVTSVGANRRARRHRCPAAWPPPPPPPHPPSCRARSALTPPTRCGPPGGTYSQHYNAICQHSVSTIILLVSTIPLQVNSIILLASTIILLVSIISTRLRPEMVHSPSCRARSALTPPTRCGPPGAVVGMGFSVSGQQVCLRSRRVRPGSI